MQQWMVANKKADFRAVGDRFGIDQVTARILRNRDLTEDNEIRRFLTGGMDDLYDPHLLLDGDKLVGILEEKIRHGAKIRVIGDYDIDGVMSSYIFHTGLSRCGADVSVAIPHRITDGYGLNVHLIDEAHDDGVDVILTCDNGIAAIAEIAHAKELGMTVLVTDHHEVPYDEIDGERQYKKSEADATVNPHQPDCPYPCKVLCGAAVAWKITVLLYEKMGVPASEAEDFLEDVAFATVGDIVPLVDENRILVKEGLSRIKNTKNVGMKALIEQCSLSPDSINCYHFGFVLGPCINAAGRLDTAQRAFSLFTEKDRWRAEMIAAELAALNASRKDMTEQGVKIAKSMIDDGDYFEDRVLALYIPEVHESIAGIIAGRVREAYYKPTFILTDAEEGVKGSGRSIEGYMMYDELCKCEDLLMKFGGHPMAAGLTLPRENVEVFRKRLNEQCSLSEQDLMEKIHIDVPMPVGYVTEGLIEELGRLEPFGTGNPRPLFADRGLSVRRLRVLGKNKNVLKLSLTAQDGRTVEGIYFGDVEKFLSYMKEKFGDDEVARALGGLDNGIGISIVYSPAINEFRGERSIQFEIKHYR